MFWSSWPVVHLPQVLLLKFFYGDQVILAFLMREFGEAVGAKKGTLFTSGAQADYFHFLVFVLFAHAEEFRF
jgi:hypothetical protein